MTTLSQVYSFAFNGQVFGGANSPYQIQSVDGLESLPGIRNQDDNRGYHDGYQVWASNYYPAGQPNC